MRPFTLIDDGRPVTLPVEVGGRGVRVAPAQVKAILGWTVKPEGLCRGAECVPWRPGTRSASREGVSLDVLAERLGRPLAVDVEEGAAYLGAAAHQRAAALQTLVAPDFTLPDLEGRPRSLGEHRGRKVLLIAWASW